jgi:hypothetical protein
MRILYVIEKSCMTEEGLVQTETQGGESSENTVQFNLSVTPDRDGFLRRTCSSCGLDFKTEIDPADFAWALTSQIRSVSVEIGIEPPEIAEEVPQETLRCPYCQQSAESSELHTEETIEYLKRFAYRDYALPMINRMFSGLADSLNTGSRGGGLISFSISLEHDRSPLPPRPIHGPEPADMKIVELLCCGRKIKVDERWTEISVCTFCGTEVALL